MKVKVVVDAGKFNTKAISERDGHLRKIMFRTKAMPTMEAGAPGRENYVVEVPGLEDPSLSRVLIGKRASDASVDYDKEKKKDLHKIAIYTAIADLVSSGDIVEDLIVGYPITLFKNVKARNAFSEYIKGEGEIELKLDGVPIKFTIEKVTILPESSGVILKEFRDFKKTTVGVLDFGGLNVNGCVFQGGEIVEGAYFVINKGVNIFKNDLKHALNNEFSVNIQDYMMDDILKAGFIRSDPEESRKYIVNFTNRYMEEIKNEAKRCHWDFKTLPRLVGTGGGSKLFENALSLTFPGVETRENSVWDNAEGWAKFVGLFV